MLIAVAAHFLEHSFDLLVAFPDISLLVVARADHTDELFSRRPDGKGKRSEAGGGTFQNGILEI
jgi:hypothetical protein